MVDSFEVRTDPWALARLHRPPERDALEAHGFRHLGYHFVRIPGSWERAQGGFTVEALVHADATTIACLDLFYDVPLVALETLLEDGTIVVTRHLPESAEHDGVAQIVFASHPHLGRDALNLRAWDPAVLLATHRDRVARISAERGSAPARHDDMRVYFAIDERGVDIARASSEAGERVGRLVLLGALLLAAVAASACVGLVPGRVAVGTALTLPFWLFAVPWHVATAWVTRLPRVPASALTARAEVVARLGDHRVTHGTTIARG